MEIKYEKPDDNEDHNLNIFGSSDESDIDEHKRAESSPIESPKSKK